jgi:hypothetical protein
MTATKGIVHNHQRVSGHLQPGILKDWILPVLIIGILLILAIVLLPLILKGAFAQYANCNYLVVERLGMDPFFCSGYDVKVFDTTIFAIPGMKDVLDPPLEIVRSAAAWVVVLLFAFISLFLTIIVVNWKTIVRLITFHKEEWKKFMDSTGVWLLFFVGICSIFYFAVVQ